MSTTTVKANRVVGVFRQRAAAEACFDDLLEQGFSATDISILMSDKTRASDYQNRGRDVTSKPGTTAGSRAVEGVGVGGAVGTAVGATIAALAAIGTSVVLPGLNVIIAGPLLAAFAGGGAGAVTGGLVGGLVGLGIAEQDAQTYNKALVEGGVIMMVNAYTDDETRALEKIMLKHSGEQVCAIAK